MRVLLAGLGSIGRRHLRLLRARTEITDLVAYRRSATGSVDGVTEFEELDAALATDPDVAFVTNPTHLHVETALTCARADCDLFVEKPLSHSRDRVDELGVVVDERDLVTMVGCQLRFTPVLQRVEAILAERRYGDVLSFEAYSGSYLPDWRPEQDYRESYSAHADRGGGAILDLIHELDYAHWLFGPFTDVCGRPKRVSNLDIETEDVAVMTVESPDLVGTIHVDYCRPTPRRTLEAVFEDAVVTADLVDQALTVETRDDTRREAFEYDRDDPFEAQLDHFLEAVARREATCNEVSEGKEVLDLALNAKASHR
jgi:predicted dehydrogenase